MIIKTQGTQKESKIINQDEAEKEVRPSLVYSIEYDTMKPVEKFYSFVSEVTAMINKYDENVKRLAEVEAELVDLEHYIEIADYKNAPKGYKLYRKLAELRRERRALKNENELLTPIRDHCQQNDTLKKLSHLRNECTKKRYSIDARMYQPRTSVLDDYILNAEPEKKLDDHEEHEEITENAEEATEA